MSNIIFTFKEYEKFVDDHNNQERYLGFDEYIILDSMKTKKMFMIENVAHINGKVYTAITRTGSNTHDEEINLKEVNEFISQENFVPWRCIRGIFATEKQQTNYFYKIAGVLI